MRLAAAEKRALGASSWGTVWPVMDQSAEIRDRAGVNELGDAIDKMDPPADASERATFESDFAACYARVGELDRYRKHIARAESALADIKNDPQSSACNMLMLARAYACAADSARVDALLATSEKAGDTTSFQWQNNRDNVAFAYIESGHLDEALRFEDGDRWRRKESIAMSIALKMAGVGRFDDALILAGKLKGERDRIGCLSGIAEAQVHQHNTEGLAVWIDRLPAPAERALVNLDVADSITEKKLVEHWLQQLPDE